MEDTYKDISLLEIRNKNKRADSFLSAKIKKKELTQKEFEDGRQVFINFIEPINNRWVNYEKI